MKKIAIVTGGSGGIGRCTAASLKAAGCTVYEISRRDIPSDGRLFGDDQFFHKKAVSFEFDTLSIPPRREGIKAMNVARKANCAGEKLGRWD